MRVRNASVKTAAKWFGFGMLCILKAGNIMREKGKADAINYMVDTSQNYNKPMELEFDSGEKYDVHVVRAK